MRGAAHIRTVMFDIGGVLVNSRPDPTRIASILGLDPRSRTCVDLLDHSLWAHREDYDRGMSDRAFWDRVAGDCGLGEITDDVLEALVEEDVHRMDQPDPAALALVDELRAGGTELAILSNAPTCIATKVQSTPWASSRFGAMFFSAPLGVCKPQRSMYSHALKQLDVPATQVAFVDDRKENLRAAELLGITPILWDDARNVRDTFIAEGLLLATA
ncbi:HAD family phosphatase [Schaalia sp. 19OD2882]|uniref:HAD family hydrolase n=1 Tax=Schaalia sp. 19OD2882 TaxID=2794089 RepID=UPI001C1EEABA|nr:HAD family phosphatase [Schaalia sp. 19OD2882]QWW19568.1 HAD family phosphatase [Schaalia sp. 19OD2882]